jgi:oxygen-independent coproporphyrinogen-3 oxidase
MPEMVLALGSEIASREGFEQTETLYFGGGTPSLLTDDQIERLINAVNQKSPLAPNSEITLEVNPEDVNPERLKRWSKMGVNRVSMGIQSFRERDLQLMNRVHNAEQAMNSLSDLANSEINSINADLIFAIPGQSLDDLYANIEQMSAFPIEHISAYALTIEPRTKLFYDIEKGVLQAQSDEQYNAHFRLVMEELAKRGYEQYEISNYSKPNKRSRHNSSYWSGKPYVGIGPGAHSFDGENRRWNISNNSRYIKGLSSGEMVHEEEQLSHRDRLNEYVMTSLRRIEGVRYSQIQVWANDGQFAAIVDEVERYKRLGKLEVNKERFMLTTEGKLIADSIASDLFQLD